VALLYLLHALNFGNLNLSRLDVLFEMMVLHRNVFCPRGKLLRSCHCNTGLIIFLNLAVEVWWAHHEGKYFIGFFHHHEERNHFPQGC
jgi:hypothetical protein